MPDTAADGRSFDDGSCRSCRRRPCPLGDLLPLFVSMVVSERVAPPLLVSGPLYRRVAVVVARPFPPTTSRRPGLAAAVEGKGVSSLCC